MRKEKLHILTMIAGLILAASIVFTNVFVLRESKISASDPTTEKDQQDSPKDLSFTDALTISLPTSSHVQLNLETYCLFQIIAMDDEEEVFISEFSFHPRRFLSTLLTVIISPNAP